LSTADNCFEPSEPARHRRIEVGSRILERRALLQSLDNLLVRRFQFETGVEHRYRCPLFQQGGRAGNARRTRSDDVHHE